MPTYNGFTETVALLPGLPQTTTEAGWTQTAALISSTSVHVGAYIDGYCARRYAVPLNGATVATDAVPPLIRLIAIDLTAYRVFRAAFPRDSVSLNEWVDKYNEAKEELQLIRDGELDLTDTAGGYLAVRDVTTTVDGSHDSYAPVFQMDTSTGWRVDPDLLTNISDNR